MTTPFEQHIVGLLFTHRWMTDLNRCGCGWRVEEYNHFVHQAKMIKAGFFDDLFIKGSPSIGRILAHTRIQSEDPPGATGQEQAEAQTVRAFTAMPCKICGTLIDADTDRMLCIISPNEQVRLANICLDCWGKP